MCEVCITHKADSSDTFYGDISQRQAESLERKLIRAFKRDFEPVERQIQATPYNQQFIDYSIDNMRFDNSNAVIQEDIMFDTAMQTARKEFTRIANKVKDRFGDTTGKLVLKSWLKTKVGNPKLEDLETIWAQSVLGWTQSELAASMLAEVEGVSLSLAKSITRRAVEFSLNEGLSTQDAARVIRNALYDEGGPVSEGRAMRIARTEIISASNEGSFIGANSIQSDRLLKKWSTSGLPGIRPSHQQAEFNSRNGYPMDQMFTLSESQGRYPADLSFSAADRINCRCTIIYDLA